MSLDFSTTWPTLEEEKIKISEDPEAPELPKTEEKAAETISVETF